MVTALTSRGFLNTPRAGHKNYIVWGGFDQTTQGPQGPSGPTPKREQKGAEQRAPPKSLLSPDRESQSEERKSVIDAVRQITRPCKETLAPEGMSVGDTPEYDWDTRYDDIRGFFI